MLLLAVVSFTLCTGVIRPLGTQPLPEEIVSVATVSIPATSATPSTTIASHTMTTPTSVHAPLMAVSTTHSSPVNAHGIILSSALQPIPARLTRRILSGEFVEMRDLLMDNMALHDQLESVQGPLLGVTTTGALRARLREVPSLISWVFCFVAYMSVRTTDPVTWDMLTYCRLIIREALRHGGRGWQDYDRTFRTQAAIDQSIRWNVILPDLQASTILGQRSSGGLYCTLCTGIDHASSQCALSVMQQPLITQPPIGTGRGTHFGGRRPPRPRPICSSWNSGRCWYPGTCSFRHVCATCGQHHQARDCADTPPESQYRRSPRIHGSTQPPGPSSGQRPSDRPT